ncbi:hypothetical protein CC2G_004689 [Coprinopsis cinerea AmutBmut pab1-1]|nr:hypothetical protein CC2G_004689 [Coprinopsis cinerea AmutBmut pab1-1]
MGRGLGGGTMTSSAMANGSTLRAPDVWVRSVAAVVRGREICLCWCCCTQWYMTIAARSFRAMMWKRLWYTLLITMSSMALFL